MTQGYFIDYGEGQTEIDCPCCGFGTSFDGFESQHVCKNCGETYYLSRRGKNVIASADEYEIDSEEEAYNEVHWTPQDYNNYYGNDDDEDYDEDYVDDE